MDKLKLSTANLVILISGVVILIASFLAFRTFDSDFGSHSFNAWSNGSFIIATIPALLGAVMALHVALEGFAPQVNMPDSVLGFTWTQVHLVLAFQATIMMLAFLIEDTGALGKGIGLYLMLIAAIGLLVGAVLRMQEKAAPRP